MKGSYNGRSERFEWKSENLEPDVLGRNVVC
jgi:hypothetical protein